MEKSSTRRFQTICVFGGSSFGKDPEFIRATCSLGRLLATKKIKLVYGESSGLMECVVKSALSSQGIFLDMDNHRGENILDINRTTDSSESGLPQHNFMSMFTLNDNHQVGEIDKSYVMNQLEQNLENFWKERKAEIHDAPSDVSGQRLLPLARIKKVMKSDGQVKMISAITPIVFAKACEMFMMELTLRAWMISHNNKRRTLQRGDIARAIRQENLLNFLHDIVPMEIQQEPQEGPGDQPGVHVSLPELNVTPSYQSYTAFLMQTQCMLPGCSSFPLPPPLPSPVDESNLDDNFKEFLMKNQGLIPGCSSFPPVQPSPIDESNLASSFRAFLMKNQGIIPSCSSFPPPPPLPADENNLDNFKRESTKRHGKRMGQ